MKITILNGSMPNFDFGLIKVTKIVSDTLIELGVEVSEINLSFVGIPYFDGIQSKSTEEVMKSLTESTGVVFASSAPLYAPTAIMQTFLEHLTLDEYSAILKEKNCMIIAVSKNGGEKSAIESYGKIINYLGGFDTVKIGLNSSHIHQLEQGEAIRDLLEKQIEDFYRVTRQGRRYIIPSDVMYPADEGIKTYSGPAFTEEEVNRIKMAEKKAKVPIDEVYQKLGLVKFDEKQEQEINEISSFFAKKLTEEGSAERVVIESFTPKGSPVKPRSKTCKQMTQSLPHYFQPQLSGGLTAVIQFTISGSEIFEGYVKIQNTECEYMDGRADNPDLIILSDSDLWMDVLKNKYTAQKAFMIGRLKVRGNFVLLTKFDQLFQMNV